MAFGEVVLAPGVNVERTPTLNRVGISAANLTRWKIDGQLALIEKIGGWARYYPLTIGSIPRDLHPWQDLNTLGHLGIGATKGLFNLASGILQDITPQTTVTNTAPNFATTSGSPVVTVTDSNITGPTTNNSVFIATPVSIGGLVLFGLYEITANISSHVYQITATQNATETTGIANINNITQANPGVVTTATNHGLNDGDIVYISGVGGMTQVNGIEFAVAGKTPTTFQLNSATTNTGVNTTGYGAFTSGGTVNSAVLPMFTTTSGSASVTVTWENHGFSAGQTVVFLVSTTVGGTTIFGEYVVQSVIDVNNFTISTSPSASSSTIGYENGNLVQFTYYIAIGPQAAASPYGAGPYGNNAYGIGAAAPSGTGTPITAIDWTQDNWGEILVSCPQGGGVYIWRPNSGFVNAQLVGTAPIVNGGIFIANPFQILVAWGSSKTGFPSPLQIYWCTIQDFTVWTPLTTNLAGGYPIPTGSKIMGGMSAPQQQLIWTDLDLWSMQFVGFPNVFGFNKLMTGCGLVGSHAAGILGSTVYWMSQLQFFALPAGGSPRGIPCSVWDFIFQNLDTANAYKIRCAPNSAFGTIAWHFPSVGSGGENNMFVEYHPESGNWATGQYPTTGRSAWTDQSVLGSAIGGTPSQLIFQHEIGYDGDGAAINPTFTTGYFVIDEAEDFCFIDQVLPDFKYGLQSGAQNANLLVTISVVDYPNDTPRTYGPFSFNTALRFITTRARGRQASLTVQSLDSGSFWRLGLFRYRYSKDGRR